MQMTCPKCHGDMRTYERSGVTIDQCGECRGIFLDRGELEKLFDAEANFNRSTPQAAAAPRPQQPPPPPGGGYAPPPPPPVHAPQPGYPTHVAPAPPVHGYPPAAAPAYGHHGHYRHQGHHGHYRRKSFLHGLFD